MRESLRRALVLLTLLAALLAAALSIAYVVGGGPAGELSRRTAIVASVLAIIGAVSPVLVWARTKGGSAAQASTPAQVAAAADVLATRTSVTWSKELVRRGIEAPVRVRWRWAGPDVAVPLQEFAASSARSSDPEPLPAPADGGSSSRQVLGSGLITRLHEEVYSRLRHGRLVLIGGAGAGKSAAMMLLLTESLQHREQLPEADRGEVPVPVWLTLGSWDPTSQGLREWVTQTMARDYPYLRAGDFGPDAIGQLFDSGRIALFLDGLDELPDAHRGRAVELLAAETPGLRVTVTSRPGQYRATLAAGSQLPYAAVVELHPVGVRAAGRYLLEAQVGPARQSWQRVIDEMASAPDGALARTLSTPLTLSLARSAYLRADPTELLSPDLSTAEALRGHLLDQVLVAAYPDEQSRARTTRWLEWIAFQMSNQPAGASRDLRWWEIPRWVFRWRRQLGGAGLGGLVCAPGVVLAFYGIPSEGPVLGPVVFVLAVFGGLAAGLLATLVLGHSADGLAPSTHGQPSSRIARPSGMARLRAALLIGSTAGISCGLSSAGLWYLLTLHGWWLLDAPAWVAVQQSVFVGLLIGAVVGTVFGVVVGPAHRDPQAMVLRLPTRRELRQGQRQIVVGALPAGLLAGTLMTFTSFATSGPATALLALVVALTFGFSVGVILWLFSDVWSLPIATATDATPRSVYRKDVQTRLLAALLFALAGLPLGLVIWALNAVAQPELYDPGLQNWLVETLMLGLWLGLNVGLVFALVGGLRNGAAPLLLCTEIAFALRGRPVRFLPLLESARDRQVLRQAGAVYQFRHAELQDRLADRHRQGRTPGSVPQSHQGRPATESRDAPEG